MNVASVSLENLKLVGNDAYKEQWKDLYWQMDDSAYELIKLKGYTFYVIVLFVTDLAESLIKKLGWWNPFLPLLKISME